MRRLTDEESRELKCYAVVKLFSIVYWILRRVKKAGNLPYQVFHEENGMIADNLETMLSDLNHWLDHQSYRKMLRERTIAHVSTLHAQEETIQARLSSLI
ncbi:MAG: hypothetical protein AAFR59_16460 [Bacteroidota bacterium]